MRQERHRQSDSAEKTVRYIRRVTRRWFSAEDKIRIVLEGLRGEVRPLAPRTIIAQREDPHVTLQVRRADRPFRQSPTNVN